MHLPSNRPIEAGPSLPPVPAHLRQLAAEQIATRHAPRQHFRPVPHYLNQWAVHLQSQQRIIWHRMHDEYQISRFRARWEAMWTQNNAVLELLETAFALDAEDAELVRECTPELRGLELWGELYPAVGELIAPATRAVGVATEARTAYLKDFYALVKDESQFRAHLNLAA